MARPATEFNKYREKGAYHWDVTYARGWRRSSAIAHARYDIVLRRVDQRVGIRGSLGLDLGCGDGVLLHKIARRKGRAVGLDLELEGMRQGRPLLEQYGTAIPPLICGNGYELPFPDCTFDYVVSVELFEHLSQPQRWLAEVRRVLVSGGVLALTTPRRLESGEVQDPYHVREYDGQELTVLMRKFFDDVTVEGQFPLFLRRMYQNGVGFRPLDLGLRAIFKVLSRTALNPFTCSTTMNPGFEWHGLVGVGAEPLRPPIQ